jgi:hypothetical protein
MHVTKDIISSVNVDSRSNSIESTNNTEIVMQQQMLGFCNDNFKNKRMCLEDSTLILNNDTETLVERHMVEEDLMLIGLEIEGVSNGYINGDIAFSSSHIEPGPLILTQNLSLNQSLHDNVSLETINEGYPIKREAFKFLHSESFYSLYPDMFVHYNIHFDINDFQVKTPLWSILV